jgi:hypothetical protein
LVFQATVENNDSFRRSMQTVISIKTGNTDKTYDMLNLWQSSTSRTVFGKFIFKKL